MNDRLPGTTYDNPVWHGKWRIYLNDVCYDDAYSYTFCHDSFDGAPDANDSRYGYAKSIDDAKAQIDDRDD